MQTFPEDLNNFLKLSTEELNELKEEASKNNLEALNNLGIYYFYSEKNKELALEYLNKAAELNSPEAYFNLGVISEDNKELAFSYFKKSADFNYTNALYNVALMYLGGIGTEKDQEQSFFYMELAAEADEPKALFYVGKQYIVSKKDIDLGLKYLLKSSETLSEATYFLSLLYKDGLFIKQDIEKALFYLKKASEQFHHIALYTMSLFYLEGSNGFEKNEELAFDYMYKSAACKFPDAQYSLALMYQDGRGTEKNIETAISLYKMAADKNFPPALNNLGLLFVSNNHIQEGFDLIKKAVSLGYSKGQAALDKISIDFPFLKK